jgi:2-methylcitrate dehydratase PrpD
VTGQAAVSATLARFVTASRPEDLPASLLLEGKRSLVNYFATALAGCKDVALERILGVAMRFAGPPVAGVIGRGERCDALTAAFLNAISANVHDFDDTHPDTVIHPTAPVASAVLALAQVQRISGRELLHAFALGVEAECRIGNAVSPWHYAKGWHITSTCGVFGSAVAVGRLLGLTAPQMVWALGNASAQSAGLLEPLGFMAKSLSVGNAARNGMVAAMAAAADVEGPALPLEGPRGFLSVMGQDAQPDAITSELGVRWEALRNTYKPYPCGIVLHAVIDACLAVRHSPGMRAELVSEVIVRGHPLLGQRANRPHVSTGREAQVSAQHAVAVALLTGKAGLAEFSDVAVNAPATLQLRERVRVEDVPAMSIHAAEIIVVTDDGRRLVQRVDHARGSEQLPLSDAELDAKLKELVAYGASGVAPQPLLDALWNLDQDGDAGRLVTLAARS